MINDDNRVYTKDFLLALRKQYTEPPLQRFHPVYIGQKRVNIGGNNDSKWGDLEKIRAFSSSENSFIQRTRNRSKSEIQIGEIRNLLNKLTNKTFKSIQIQLQKFDYSEFDDKMQKQVVKVYLLKFITDASGVCTEQHKQIGNIFAKKLKNFGDEIECLCQDIFDAVNEIEITDVQKCKCIGLMRILPHIIDSIVTKQFIETSILKPILAAIDERKNIETSYANVATTPSCALHIELLCKFCEQFVCSNIKEYTNTNVFIELLEELCSLKTVPPRARFMAEDTLEILRM